VNQIENHWLLPLFTYIMEHKDQALICNIASPAMASKVLKASNIVNLLTDISSNMSQQMRPLSDTICILYLSILNTLAFMPILNWTVFRRECNVLLKARRNRNRRNA
jgi:hypothetical protein